MPSLAMSPHALHEAVPADDVEAGRGLVEHERARIGDERPREQHAPRFAARHLVHQPPREMGRAHPFERFTGAPAHVVGDRAVSKDALRRDEAREHRRQPGDAPFAVAADEALMQIGRDDAELRPQLEDIPVVVAEDAHRR